VETKMRNTNNSEVVTKKFENYTYAEEYALNTSANSNAGIASFIANVIDAKHVVLLSDKDALISADIINKAERKVYVTSVYETPVEQDSAVQKINSLNITDVRSIRGSVSEILPRLSDNLYDLIIVSGGVQNYKATLEHFDRLVSPKGVLLLTNMFDDDKLTNPAIRDDSTNEKRNIINNYIEQSDSYQTTLIPSAQGILLVRKVK
jgi:predicted O-methyltransferase YrrM